jgi:hypothetical protein
MRKLLLGSIAVAIAVAGAASAADLKTMPILKATPPPAPPQASGYVEAYSGWASTENFRSVCDFPTGLPSSCDVSDDKFNGWALGGAGRANYWFWPNASLQVDAQAEGTSYQKPGTDPGHFSTLAYLVAAHINARDSQRGLIGVFGGAGDAGGGGISTSVRHGVFGGEGQLYWNQLTLYLQGGYDRTASPIDFTNDNVHAWFVRGTGRYFFDQNVMLEATGLYANGATDFTSGGFLGMNGISSLGFQTWLWQAKLEWKPATIPFSLFAKYQGAQTKYDQLTEVFPGFGTETRNQKVTDNRFLIGARLYMGQGSLQSNDRTGATLDIIDPLGTAVSPLMFQEPGGMKVSDVRLKRDIVPVGQLANGLALYRYRYLWSDTVYVGVMAQEVAEAYPSSVVRGPDGYLRVNYTSLGLRMLTLPEWNVMTYGFSL